MKNLQHCCPLCNSGETFDLSLYKNDELAKCADCSFVFSRMIPSNQDLTRLYEEDYSREDYLSPITVKRYNDLLDQFEIYRKNNRILDLGCGIGYFLVEAKKRGWQVFGTEYSEKAIEVCKSKEISVFKEISEINEGNNKDYFDIVTSFEVLEHFNYPQKQIGSAVKLLRQDGLYYATVPNFNSLSRYYLKTDWVAGICAPEHLSYFTPRTIRNTFKSLGFRVLRVKTSGVSLVGMRRPSEYTAEEFLSADSKDERLRVKTESNSLLKFVKYLINTGLNLFGLGDTIKGSFVKIK